jgi:hypothetical protein
MKLLEQLEVGWSLERVSENRWCVYETYAGYTLSDAKTPEEAIYNAINKPMTLEQQKYSPSYAWNFIFG